MITYSAQFEIDLRALIAEEIADKTKNLVSGTAADYADYRERLGYIRALERVSDLCDEAHTSTEKR